MILFHIIENISLALDLHVVTSFTSFRSAGYWSVVLLLSFTGNCATATVYAIYQLGPNLGRALLYCYSFFNLGKNLTGSLPMRMIGNLQSHQHSFQLYFLFVLKHVILLIYVMNSIVLNFIVSAVSMFICPVQKHSRIITPYWKLRIIVKIEKSMHRLSICFNMLLLLIYTMNSIH